MYFENYVFLQCLQLLIYMNQFVLTQLLATVLVTVSDTHSVVMNTTQTHTNPVDLRKKSPAFDHHLNSNIYSNYFNDPNFSFFIWVPDIRQWINCSNSSDWAPNRQPYCILLMKLRLYRNETWSVRVIIDYKSA